LTGETIPIAVAARVRLPLLQIVTIKEEDEMSDRWSRRAPLTAVIFAALAVAGFVISNGNSPNSDASGAKVIAYYQAHGSDSQTSDFFFVFAYIFFFFFAGSLRAHLRAGAEALSAVSLAGATLLVAGIGLFGGTDLALADHPNLLTPDAAQALNLLNNDMFFPVAAGSCVFYISAGLAIVRSGALPKWLGWVAVVLGVISVSPAFFVGFLAAIPWALITGIVMYRRGGPVTAAPAPIAPATTSV
jgi:hypothetical protein